MEHEITAAPASKKRTKKATTCLLSDTTSVHSSDGRHLSVQSSATIRAPPVRVAAHLFHYSSYVNTRLNQDRKDVLIDKILERVNQHHIVIHYGHRFPNPLADRDFVHRYMFKKVMDDEFLLVVRPCEHKDAPAQPDVVRAQIFRSFRVTKISEGVAQITCTTQTDLAGSIPKYVNDTLSIPAAAGLPLSVLRRFVQVKKTAQLDAADAKELGLLLVLDLNGARSERVPQPLKAKLKTFVERTAALRSVQNAHPWFEALLFEMLRNRLRVPKGCDRALVEITEGDARKVGRAFANALVANVTAEAAVDEWVLKYPALGELEQRYTFVRPMMNAAAGAILDQVSWGVRFRAYLGAGVSVADGASDAYMINKFYEMGDAGAANGLLAMVGANLAFQLIIVYVQTQGLKKNKWRTALFEMLSVITFVKPGLDAHRVARGAEQPPGAAVKPLMEMAFTKAGELFFEAIPGLILQITALLRATGNEWTASAVVSIAISVASTALTATTITYDFDTDPASRKRNPDWIGIIPDLGRGSAFAVIFVMSALQTLARAVATALLAVTSGSWLLCYIVTDHGVHLIYRVYRRDVIFLIPTPPAAAYITSPLFRVIQKAIVDFTGTLQFRLPLILGGSYWLFSLIMSQASVFVCVHLYNEYAALPDGVNKVDAGTLWAGAEGLAVAWLLAFAYFTYVLATPKYRHTLWSWTSGRQCVHDNFFKGQGDEAKFNIFNRNLLLWESDIGEEVRAWTAENWARWKEEKPAWFKVEKVPDQFIPAAELLQLGMNRRRRGSAAAS
ncbi:hypothetical protein TeGR_g14783, partial [Tetraparma gracilis]